MISIIKAAEQEVLTDSVVADSVQTWAPLVGGFGLLLWLVWRLFWKVDRRSQQDLFSKYSEITKLNETIEIERKQRFEAEEREAKLAAEVSGLRQNVSDLTATVQLLRNEIAGLKLQIGGSHASSA